MTQKKLCLNKKTTFLLLFVLVITIGVGLYSSYTSNTTRSSSLSTRAEDTPVCYIGNTPPSQYSSLPECILCSPNNAAQNCGTAACILQKAILTKTNNTANQFVCENLVNSNEANTNTSTNSEIPIGYGGEGEKCYVNTIRVPFCRTGLFPRGGETTDCMCGKNQVIVHSIREFVGCDTGLESPTCKLWLSWFDELETEQAGLEPYPKNDKGESIGYYTHTYFTYTRFGKKILGSSILTDRKTVFTKNAISTIYFQPYVDTNKLFCGGQMKNEWDCRVQMERNTEGIPFPSDSFKEEGLKEGVDYFYQDATIKIREEKNVKLGGSCNILRSCLPGYICGLSGYASEDSVCKDKVKYKKEYILQFSFNQFDASNNYSKQTLQPIGVQFGNNSGNVESLSITNEYNGDKTTFFDYDLVDPEDKITISSMQLKSFSLSSHRLNGLFLLFSSCDGKTFKRDTIGNATSRPVCNWSSPGPKTIRVLGFDFSTDENEFNKALQTFNTSALYTEASIKKGIGDIKNPKRGVIAIPEIDNSVTFIQVKFTGVKDKQPQRVR